MFLSLLSIISFLIIYVDTQSNPNGTFCNSGNQSPIDISDSNAKFIPEKYFRLLFINYTNFPQGSLWTINNTDLSLQIGNMTLSKFDMGSVVIIKDYAMYQFNLSKILFRTPSEHTFNGTNYDGEIQLIHTFAWDINMGGRKILLTSNYLVISVFLKITNTTTNSTTSIFNFTNLNDFLGANSQGFSRDIKMRNLLINMPAYLYEGSLTSANCDPAIWILQSNFNYISQNDYNNLIKGLEKLNPPLKTNNRQIMPSTLIVYKNQNFSYSYAPSLINYNDGSRYVFSLGLILTILLFIF